MKTLQLLPAGLACGLAAVAAAQTQTAVKISIPAMQNSRQGLAAALGLRQIVSRFVIERPAEWTEVLIRLSLIWRVFLVVPPAFRIGAMVSGDVLYRHGGARLRRALDALVALAAVIVVVGWDYALRGRVQMVTWFEEASILPCSLLNAVLHRDYSVGAAIQIRVCDDRLSLWNPTILPDGC